MADEKTVSTELRDRARVMASKLALISALLSEGGDDFFSYSGITVGLVAILDEAAAILREV